MQAGTSAHIASRVHDCPMREFDAILFDAGGVLVLPDPTVLGPLLAYYGGDTSVDQHVRAHYRAMAVKSRAGAGETSWGDYHAAYVRSVGVSEASAVTATHAMDLTFNGHLWRWPIVEHVSALRALAAASVPIGIVSNAHGQIEEALSRSGVCQVGQGPHVPVCCVIDSHVVGVAKPDPRIFDFALRHFDGVARDRVAYVGDTLTMDVAGARAAGLRPILLDPYDDHAGVDVDRIRSLKDLVSQTRTGS